MADGGLFFKLGLICILVGVVISYAPWLFSWFGKLPGDIRMEGEKWFVFMPITSMLISSIILTLLLNLFFHK
ncbi:MAG: DUF2905 domain-containing protein [Methylococcaceae bacterium]|jgi:Protein of unknown function (DUF2905).